MQSIRSGKGIGDNIYLQSIVRHLVEEGAELEVCTDWPDIFRPLRGKIKLSPHRRLDVDRVSHYTSRKSVGGTSQFQDCCIHAGVSPDIDLRLDWVAHRWWDAPVILLQLPRQPFDRVDGYGRELLPNCSVIQRAIDMIGNRAMIVQVGKGEPLFKFRGVVDLAGQTTVGQLIDYGCTADGFLGYCSFFVPLAETFSSPALFVWSQRGLNSNNPYIRTITPQKILHRASSRFVVDDCTDSELEEAVDALLDEARGKAALRGKVGCDSRKRAGGSG